MTSQTDPEWSVDIHTSMSANCVVRKAIFVRIILLVWSGKTGREVGERFYVHEKKELALRTSF